MNRYTIFDTSSPGFTKLKDNQNWAIGLINYTDHLKAGHLKKRERHLLSDEVFILTSGEASLYIGIEMHEVVLQIGKAYSVARGTWHAISMSENAKVFVVEDSGTGPENSEYHFFENQ